MPFMTWNDRLTLGIPQIDADHRRLVNLLNLLYDSVSAGIGRNVVHDVMDELLDYTAAHFAREEQMLGRLHYPETLEHEAEHQRLALWCVETRASLAQRELRAPSLQIMNYLKDWLFEHIMDSDQRYGQWMHERGLC